MKISNLLINLIIMNVIIGFQATAKAKNIYRGHIVNGIDWIDVAAEYNASVIQTFNAATAQLERRINATDSAIVELNQFYPNKPKAIIVDIDETLISNLTAQKSYEAAGEFQQDLWQKWVERAEAPALPGALKFINKAKSMGITVFYVTNRSAKLEAATRKNLLALGFPMSDQFDDLLMKHEMKNWQSNKTARRLYVAEKYQIIMLVGDNLHDFIAADGFSQQQRDDLVKQYHNYWGERWFLLANPMYGSWLDLINK